jgi:hypothetical protein
VEFQYGKHTWLTPILVTRHTKFPIFTMQSSSAVRTHRVTSPDAFQSSQGGIHAQFALNGKKPRALTGAAIILLILFCASALLIFFTFFPPSACAELYFFVDAKTCQRYFICIFDLHSFSFALACIYYFFR